MMAAHDLAVAAMFWMTASWSLVRGSERQAPRADMAAALTSLTEVLIWRVSVAGKALPGAIRERSLCGGIHGRISKAATWTCSRYDQFQQERTVSGSIMTYPGIDQSSLVDTHNA
jgi:hypothetical protein